MGCLKLAYYQTEPTLKVAYRNGMLGKKVVQCWLRVDPLSSKYVHNSTYAFSENKVINHVELEGLEAARTVPEWLKKSYTYAANSVFKASFSDNLPKSLIDNYSYGQGKNYTLSHAEMVSVNAVNTGIQGITENDIKDFGTLISGIKKGATEKINIIVAGAALNSGTLGRFGINFQGYLTKDKDGNSWSFTGTMQFNDTWDFKTTPTRDGDIQRSNAGDIMTQIGDMFLPGRGFEVTSPKVPVRQTSDQKSVSFFNDLSPQPIINRIANEYAKSTND